MSYIFLKKKKKKMPTVPRKNPARSHLSTRSLHTKNKDAEGKIDRGIHFWGFSCSGLCGLQVVVIFIKKPVLGSSIFRWVGWSFGVACGTWSWGGGGAAFGLWILLPENMKFLENVARSSRGHGGRCVRACRMEFRDGIDMKFQLLKKIAKKIAIEL